MRVMRKVWGCRCGVRWTRSSIVMAVLFALTAVAVSARRLSSQWRTFVEPNAQ